MPSRIDAKKTVIIQIDPEDLRNLKQSGYRLCIAKQVDSDPFNVIWQAYADYLPNNSFSWVPSFELFGCNVFAPKTPVKITTNSVPIAFGQQSTLDSIGILSAAQTGGPATSFALINAYGLIHPGISQLSTGIDGRIKSTPIYVTVNPIVIGTARITPVDVVLVWFEQNVDTGMMFTIQPTTILVNASSIAVRIDLTKTDTEARLYKAGRWQKF
jgi:hypothetical protein